MQSSPGNTATGLEGSRRFVGWRIPSGGRHTGLLMAKTQDKRERFLHVIVFAVGFAAFGLLTGVALAVGIGVWIWQKYRPSGLDRVSSRSAAARRSPGSGESDRLQRGWGNRPGALAGERKDRVCQG